jgi:ribonucleoside-diphosphate reductase alpha chain
MRFEKSEPIAQYLMEHNPAMIEQDKAKPTGVILVLPQKSPDRSIYRTEDVFDLLERVKYFSTEWVRNGHIHGSNTHNVSCTISVKPDEWKKVGAWMWANRDFYNGIAVLPYDGGQYIQAPFEDCTKEKYETLMKALKKVDLTKIVETDDNTVIGDTIACAGNSCEI